MTKLSQNAKGKKAGVIFAMRYPDDIGFVWKNITSSRDFAAFHMLEHARCYIAYPKLTEHPACDIKFMTKVCLECHSKEPQSLQLLEKFIIENNVRVIVFMAALPSTLPMEFFNRLGVKTINTENDGFDHNKRDQFHSRFAKFVVRRILKRQVHDMHLANALAQQEFLMRYAFIPPSRTALVYDGVDHYHFAPGDKYEACKKLGLDPNRQWLICVSQSRPEKRVDSLIKVFQAVAHSRPSIKLGLIYVGGGECLQSWRDLATSLGIAEFVHFAGSKGDVSLYYKAASIMVHASMRESFGLAIVEAMSSGIPVVSTRSAGPCETIVHGVTGFLVDSDELAEMRELILYYIDNEAIRAQHGESARKRVTELFTFERHVKQLSAHILRYIRSSV